MRRGGGEMEVQVWPPQREGCRGSTLIDAQDAGMPHPTPMESQARAPVRSVRVRPRPTCDRGREAARGGARVEPWPARTQKLHVAFLKP